MVPPGFERLLLGHAIAVARSNVALNIRESLVSADGSRSTMHEYAARHPAARALAGRGGRPAYAVPLPRSAERIVIRHNRHGGLFASLTGDLFFSPTRAPHELEMSLALARLGVPTPEVLAYAVYPPGGLLQRSDVASREIPASRDLAQVITQEGAGERTAAFDVTARLMGTMARAGVRHHDLNAKNVLITSDRAYVLDVDRVVLGGKADVVFAGNLGRLTHSLRKWRDQSGARISEHDIGELEAKSHQELHRET